MKEQLKILIVEDSENDTQLIVDYLKWNNKEIIFERVETAKEMESALNKTSWDIIYSDYCLPKFSGFDALKLLQKKKIEIPFLVISGKIGEEKAVEIIKAGANDYIMKGSLARLLPATEKLLQEFEMRKQFNKVQQEWEKTEKNFEIIFHKSMDVILIIDTKSGKILNTNRTTNLLLGYKEDYLIGKHFSVLFPDESDQFQIDLIDQVQTYGSVLERQEFLRADGSTCLMDLSATLISWNSNKAFLTTLRDVSERVRGENELRISEEKYRVLVENANEAIVVAQDRVLKYVNPKAVDITNFTQEELLYKPFIELIHPDDRKLVAERYQNRLKGNELPPVYPFRIVGKNGDVKWVEISAVLISWDGKPATLNFFTDVTERKQAEEAVRQSEEKYKSLYCMVRLMCDNVPDLIWAKDMKKKFVFTNKAMCEKLLNAKNTDEPIGKTDMYFAKRERETHADKPEWHTFGEICRDSDFIIMENKKKERFDEFGNVKGKFLYLDVYKAPFMNEQGKMIGTVGCGRDVTKEKHIEEKIKSSLKEKELLLKEIHHRVKNNLQLVTSLLYLQSKYIKDKETLDMILESQNRVRSMSLVHEKLYQSKNLAQINFSSYIKDLVSTLFRSYSININKIKLKFNLQKAVLDVDTAITCGLIINELVSNALKYAFPEDSSGEIQIDFKSINEGKFELLVSDNGIGLPNHFNITNESSLGMRLVKTLVEQVRGKMEFEKKDGTVFKIWFNSNDSKVNK